MPEMVHAFLHRKHLEGKMPNTKSSAIKTLLLTDFDIDNSKSCKSNPLYSSLIIIIKFVILTVVSLI